MVEVGFNSFLSFGGLRNARELYYCPSMIRTVVDHGCLKLYRISRLGNWCSGSAGGLVNSGLVGG